MNIRLWTTPSIALIAIAAIHCGGDDSTTVGSGGSSASGGKGGSAGTLVTGGSSGSLTTSGSGGLAGASGSGGSAGSVDAGSGGSSGGNLDAATDGNPCPGTPPTTGSVCTINEICAYPGGLYCGCQRERDGGRDWICLGSDGGTDPSCPTTKPTGGSSCADAGATTICYYPGMGFCYCRFDNEWACR